jgi:large subunit ribosomal protein L6
MSKIGKKVILIPAGVTVTVDNSLVTVKGPKGSLNYTLLSGVLVSQDEGLLAVAVADDSKRNFWGLTRALIQNMVIGVSEGYTIKLHILGVGFGAKIAGKNIDLALGFSHPVKYTLPAAVDATVEKDPKGNDIITLTSIDKELIGETAAQIRRHKMPEPYKGKGIRFFGEQIKLKAGKAAKK